MLLLALLLVIKCNVDDVRAGALETKDVSSLNGFCGATR